VPGRGGPLACWPAWPSGRAAAQPSGWLARGGGGTVRRRGLTGASSCGRAGGEKWLKRKMRAWGRKGEGPRSGRLTGCWSGTSEAERSGSAAALEQSRRREALPLAW
jgi:hypothetical protein